MKDRLSRYAGRVRLTPVPDETNLYFMTRADEPIEVGTPLNKSTLLNDDVAQSLELEEDKAIPSEAFKKLVLMLQGIETEFTKSDEAIMEQIEQILPELEAIVSTKANIAIGTYVGTGSSTTPITINIGFEPSFLFIFSPYHESGNTRAGLEVFWVKGSSVLWGFKYNQSISVQMNDITISGTSITIPTPTWANETLGNYHWIALG